MIQKPYLCNVFPTRRCTSGVVTKGYGGQKCRCGGVHTLYGGKGKCDALHTFFLNIHIKPKQGGNTLHHRIMANYRFVFSTGDACNYTGANDSEALEAAKGYINVMKKIDFHVGYVRVYKYVGCHRYTMIGKHEI